MHKCIMIMCLCIIHLFITGDHKLQIYKYDKY